MKPETDVSFRMILRKYLGVFVLYFAFFLANGGMETNFPFVFDARGI